MNEDTNEYLSKLVQKEKTLSDEVFSSKQPSMNILETETILPDYSFEERPDVQEQSKEILPEVDKEIVTPKNLTKPNNTIENIKSVIPDAKEIKDDSTPKNLTKPNNTIEKITDTEINLPEKHLKEFTIQDTDKKISQSTKQNESLKSKKILAQKKFSNKRSDESSSSKPEFSVHSPKLAKKSIKKDELNTKDLVTNKDTKSSKNREKIPQIEDPSLSKDEPKIGGKSQEIAKPFVDKIPVNTTKRKKPDYTQSQFHQTERKTSFDIVQKQPKPQNSIEEPKTEKSSKKINVTTKDTTHTTKRDTTLYSIQNELKAIKSEQHLTDDHSRMTSIEKLQRRIHALEKNTETKLSIGNINIQLSNTKPISIESDHEEYQKSETDLIAKTYNWKLNYV